MHTITFRTTVEDALAQSRSMRQDGWNLDTIQRYWDLLGYDIFFVNRVIETLQGETAEVPDAA